MPGRAPPTGDADDWWKMDLPPPPPPRPRKLDGVPTRPPPPALSVEPFRVRPPRPPKPPKPLCRLPSGAGLGGLKRAVRYISAGAVGWLLGLPHPHLWSGQSGLVVAVAEGVYVSTDGGAKMNAESWSITNIVERGAVRCAAVVVCLRTRQSFPSNGDGWRSIGGGDGAGGGQ
ncbi:hypothetical protein DFH27DRAFT_553484 [Peziza echinospora]|nr:hypothetical protein DFH27DRAFT_553484 [Peziza echinospora]